MDFFRDFFPLQYSESRHGKTIEYDSPLPDVSIWDQMTAYRWIQIYSAFMTLVFLSIAAVFVHDVEVVLKKGGDGDLEKQKLNNVQTKSTIIRGRDIKTDSDLKKCQACPEDVDNGITRWDMQVYAHKPKDGVLSIISNVGSDTVFWLVTALCFVILGVRMLFRHLDATFPQYMERELGDDVKLGAVFSMNPLAVVIFLIFLAPLFSNADVMWTMIGGMIVTAAAPLWLVIEPAYWTGILFMVTMALGEAVWMPKYMDLTISKACPDGEEGIFTALVNAPTFFAKFLAGVVSGYLLDKYCPEEGERHSRDMWLIIASISLSSPILVFVFQALGLWEPLRHGMKSSNEKKMEKSEKKT